MDHSGTISIDETWALADSPHFLTGNLTINAGATVTIEAGCEVLFCNAGNFNRIMVNGAIQAMGTFQVPIIFRLNTEDDGVHFHFSSPQLMSQVANGYAVMMYSNQLESRFHHCKITGLYTGLYLAANQDFSESLEVKYCEFLTYFGISCDKYSKVKIENSKISATYPFVAYANLVDPDSGGEINAHWCEITPTYRLGSLYPYTQVNLYNCKLDEVGGEIGYNNIGSNYLFNSCFIKTSSSWGLELARGNATYIGHNTIEDSLIFIHGRNLNEAGIYIKHANTRLTSRRNQYHGILGTERKALVTDSLSSVLTSDSDVILDCNKGLHHNVDDTNSPGGGDSSHTPPMYEQVTRSNAKTELYFDHLIQNITPAFVGNNEARIEWETLIPSKSIILIRRESDPYYSIVAGYNGYQNWTGNYGGDSFNSKYRFKEVLSWNKHFVEIKGLQSNTTYSYRIVGEDPFGFEFEYSEERQFTTESDVRPSLIDNKLCGRLEHFQELFGNIEIIKLSGKSE